MPAFGSIQFADLLRTTRDEETKTITAQIGDVVGEEVESDNVEMWGQQGIVARPAKAEPKKAACQGIILRETGHDVCIATRDVRGQEIAGNLKEGETCVYAPGGDGKGQARVLLKADNSLALFSRTSESAAGMGVFIDPASDTIRISNAAGHGILINGSGVQIMTAGGASGVSVGADGSVRMIGTGQTQVDGATVVLGSIAVPVASAVLVGPTGITAKPSLKVFAE